MQGEAEHYYTGGVVTFSRTGHGSSAYWASNSGLTSVLLSGHTTTSLALTHTKEFELYCYVAIAEP